MKYFLILILVVAFVAVGPILTIWAVNTLFPIANIPYNFETWCAIVLLGVFFRANVTVGK